MVNIDLYTMTEKQKKGIDFVVNAIMKKYPFIKGWKEVDIDTYETLGVVRLIFDDPHLSFHYTRTYKEEMSILMNIYYKLLPEEYHLQYNSSIFDEKYTRHLVAKFL